MTHPYPMQTNEKNAATPKLRFPEFRNESAWEPKILGEEGEFLTSLTGKSAQHFGVGSAKYVTYMNVFSNTFTDMTSLGTVDVDEGESQYPVTTGDLLLTVSSETPAEAGMSSVVLDHVPNCYLNSFCTIFRFEEQKRPNPRFLGYLMRQPLVRTWLAKRAQGSTRFNLSKGAFRSLPIALPLPAEQEKIAECLSTLDELIGAESQKLDALKAHKKWLMQQLFPREGETLPGLRFPEFENNPEWAEKTVDDLIVSLTPPKKLLTSAYLSEGDFPVIDQSQNFICGWTNDRDAIIGGELPVIVFGDHTCALKFVHRPFAQGADGIKIFRGNQSVDTGFLFYALQANPVIQESYKRHFSVLREKKISFPNKDMREQQRIASCLSLLEELIAAHGNKLEALKTHKNGLMQQLFPSPAESAE